MPFTVLYVHKAVKKMKERKPQQCLSLLTEILCHMSDSQPGILGLLGLFVENNWCVTGEIYRIFNIF